MRVSYALAIPIFEPRSIQKHPVRCVQGWINSLVGFRSRHVGNARFTAWENHRHLNATMFHAWVLVRNSLEGHLNNMFCLQLMASSPIKYCSYKKAISRFVTRDHYISDQKVNAANYNRTANHFIFRAFSVCNL